MNFQESTIILKAYTKKSGNLLNAPRILLLIQGPLSAIVIIIGNIGQSAGVVEYTNYFSAEE